jgi:hypothetical protein
MNSILIIYSEQKRIVLQSSRIIAAGTLFCKDAYFDLVVVIEEINHDR